ncbi:6-phosphogluconolactonase [Pseudoxanthomonas kalamensis DSM 18571]|uniref:6-phosphogluconolactonase n=1 Tax=Pseudoxanthomonas kalamensis TaxID=289483 RepID=UPI001390EBBB|nr:6-phosphogluconolactonase [Pseudoxanthomonas kalamensis]KAF1712381.1 6-phosphogluconolactonase [Pseudoxanthomonas kalamensis DSM 18571]
MDSAPPPLAPLCRWQRFDGPDALADALAAEVAARLRAALAERGTARLALSGGSTPARFLRALSRQPLDWAALTVTLVDERWVGEDNPRSNAALVRGQLLQGPAAAARFLPLHLDRPAPEDALADLQAALDPYLPLDVAVLGMGPDGHTASYFPGGDCLAAALDPATPATLSPMRAAGAGEPRITLTLPVLAAAGFRVLHIEGEPKRQVLEAACAGPAPALPIAAVLRALPAPLPVYWCP